MAEALFVVTVAPTKRHWTVSEALALTKSATNIKPAPDAPTMVTGLLKARSADGAAISGRERPVALTDDDWDLLGQVWGLIPAMPIEFEEWTALGACLAASPLRPHDWTVVPLQSSPQFAHDMMDGVAEMEHRELLSAAVDSGQVSLRIAGTGRPAPVGFQIQDEWLLGRESFTKFCGILGIEVQEGPMLERPEFEVPVRPQAIPVELLRLPADTEVCMREARYPGGEGSSYFSAADLIDHFKSKMERQEGGRFTLPEASRLLGEAYGQDPARWLADMVEAAVVPDGPARLKVFGFDTLRLRTTGERISRFHDYIKVDSLNEWLARNCDGLAFPDRASPKQVQESLHGEDDLTDSQRRQAERLQLFRDMGFKVPSNRGRWNGAGEVAKRLGIARQTVTDDLKAAREREREMQRASAAFPK